MFSKSGTAGDLSLGGFVARGGEILPRANGCYPLESIFLALPLMALPRVRSIEALRYVSMAERGVCLSNGLWVR